MKEQYYLNGESLPTIPVPHDCIIKNVRLKNQCIEFVFEDDISNYDSIKHYKPDAKSLIIRYHFADDPNDYSIYRWIKPNRLLAKLFSKGNENGSPKFKYEVVLEGVKGEKGEGYSKKEAQQLASKLTLQRLRKEPQFIDAIFAAKTDRTKMEEEPVSVAPSTEEPAFDIPSAPVETEEITVPEETPGDSPSNGEEDDYSLDDITANPKEQSREDIIAAAEAAAFAEEE